MSKKPLVSIIVPIYNIENYLDRCLNSIINQTYKNLEIILVDDGSTDSSGYICKRFKISDNRIKLIRKDNGGLSDARNVAIDIMKGDYVFFVDGDDFIDKKTIEELIKRAVKYKSDIVTTGYIPFYDNGVNPPINLKTVKKYDSVLSPRDALESLMYQKGCKTSAWGKLYKSKLFKNIRYPKGKICEDLPITYLLFARSDNVCISSSKLYYYLQRPDSIINSSFNRKRMDALTFAEDETNYISKEFPEIVKSAICREFLEGIYILVKLYGHNNEYTEDYRRVKQSLKKNKFIVLSDKKAPKQYRFTAAMCCISIRLTQIVLGKRYSRP